MKHLKKLALILVFLLVTLPLTGCLDELMLMEADFEALEERGEALEERVYTILDRLSYEEGLVFEQRLEAALTGMEDEFEDRLEAVFASEFTLEELERMTDAEALALMASIDLSLILQLFDEILMEVHYAVDEVEHSMIPHRQTLRLIINEPEARVNGRLTTMDQPPTIINNRTLVPLRFIGETLGAEVDWNADTKEVTYRLEGDTIQLTIDSREALVNGETVQLEVAPLILNGRTLVPARFVSEALGFDVEWQAHYRMVVINTPYTDPFGGWNGWEDEDEWEDPEIPEAVSFQLGVVVGTDLLEETQTITMLIDGEEAVFEASEYLFGEVLDDWFHYSHWGLFQAGFTEDMILVSLEYLEGVEDYIGIFADYYADKTLADVLSVEGLTVTLVGVEYMLDSDDPEDLPGFDTMINTQLTPENGETIQLAEGVVVYVEGEDGLFRLGEVADIQGDAYDYVEFYDIEGDFVYDIVIVWRV